MSILPTDFTSFVWGAVIAGAAIYASGFLKKAGEQTYTSLHEKLSPPKPIEVSRGYAPRDGTAEYVWIQESHLHEREHDGFTYFLDEKTGAKIFRMVSSGREFLMIRPASKVK